MILTAIIFSIFINRCAKERANEIVGGMDEEERNQEDVDAFRKNEEEWLMQTPLDDELGKCYRTIFSSEVSLH